MKTVAPLNSVGDLNMTKLSCATHYMNWSHVHLVNSAMMQSVMKNRVEIVSFLILLLSFSLLLVFKISNRRTVSAN